MTWEFIPFAIIVGLAIWWVIKKMKENGDWPPFGG